jgi:ABC-2 type transport system ATP-binding protein
MGELAKQRSTGPDVILSVAGLVKEFTTKGKPPVRALDEVNLQAFRGRVTGLVGADGAGKTTLIRIAAGLLTPTAGRLTVLGLDSAEDSLKIQSRIGYMPQKFGLYQDLSVMENLALYADLQGVPAQQRQTRYQHLLAMTDLDRYTRRRAGALSGGMKQKLGLACALIKSPELLLLDEPTVGVDPVSRRELWKIVYELVEHEQIGVFVSTAYLDEAERCSDVLVLHHGRLLAEGPPARFTASMRGRVALIAPSGTLKPRQIYTHLAGRDGIVDVTIHSGRVRAVCENPENAPIRTALNGMKTKIAAADPTFEDAFMALIPRDHFLFKAETTHSAESGNRREAEPDDSKVMVSTDSLCKMFGNFAAVKNLSFGVQRGEIFGLLGPNGAGKSTTFRMLCGLLPASSGKIRVAGQDLLRSRAKARARLGYMAQQFSLYGQLSVFENLRFFGRVYGLVGKQLSRRIEWAFDEFGLGQWQDKPALALPGGNKQRLAMATALLHEPEILFLDEPTSGVDPFARREFWLRINGFAEQGVTVVVTTHFMEEAEYCDRLLIMSQGQTLAMGTPTEIRDLVRSEERPEPSMDDAFIDLADGRIAPGTSASPEQAAAAGGGRS